MIIACSCTLNSSSICVDCVFCFTGHTMCRLARASGNYHTARAVSSRRAINNVRSSKPRRSRHRSRRARWCECHPTCRWCPSTAATVARPRRARRTRCTPGPPPPWSRGRRGCRPHPAPVADAAPARSGGSWRPLDLRFSSRFPPRCQGRPHPAATARALSQKAVAEERAGGGTCWGGAGGRLLDFAARRRAAASYSGPRGDGSTCGTSFRSRCATAPSSVSSPRFPTTAPPNLTLRPSLSQSAYRGAAGCAC